MRNFVLIIGLVLLVNNMFAQQEIQLSQATEHPIFYNPAVAGAEKHINLNAIYRWQWLGLQGAPQSQYLTAHFPIPLLKSGVGINLNNDIIGAYRFTKARMSYAYKLAISKNSTLSFGINAGVNQIALAGNELITSDGLYENVFNHNDPLLPNGSVSQIVPNAGIGVYFKNEQFEAGLSANSLVAQKVNFNEANATGQYTYSPQYSLQLNYLLDIFNNIQIKPTLYLHSDSKIFQLQSHVFVKVGEVFAVGGGYRGYSSYSNDAFIISGQAKIGENLSLTYSYDLGTSNIKNFNSGTHELGVTYKIRNLLPTPKSKVIYNPRFL